MARGSARGLILLLIVFLSATGAARAGTLTFTDGGTLTGSFVYDITNGNVVSFNFTSTAGGTTSTWVNGVNSSGVLFFTNQDGDQGFGFDAVQPNQNTVDELDIVFSCVGTPNCALQATTGNSFAIATGAVSCPNPGGPGFCITSEEQFGVPETLNAVQLSPNQYYVVTTDPTCPSTDSCFTFTLSTIPAGTVFDGGSTGGGGGTGVPEPSTLVLSAFGLAAFALKKICLS